MSWFISKFALAVGERFAPLLAYGTIILALLGAVWWLRADAYSDGMTNERTVWETKVAEIRAARIEAAKEAAADDAETKAAGEADITTRREELDNATQDIPDGAPSARQLERARIERMRNP